MNPVHRLAWRFSKLTKADSSHEQLLWWWLHLFMWRYWLIKRQLPAGPYKLDIAITDVKLAIEVDGEYWHLENDQPMRDAYRTKYLIGHGWMVVRFTDREIELCPAAVAWYVSRMVRKLRGKDEM